MLVFFHTFNKRIGSEKVIMTLQMRWEEHVQVQAQIRSWNLAKLPTKLHILEMEK